MNLFRQLIIRNTDGDLSSVSAGNLTNVILCVDLKNDDKTNQIILMHTAKCMKSSERFGESLSICVNISLCT